MADPTQLNPTGVRTVGLVASHRAWRSEFARYVQDHITGLRVRVLRDPRAIDDSIDVVIIDDSSTFLNRESLRQLHDAGVQVIGIYDPNEHQGQGQAHLNRLGIADVASAELMASQLVQLIQEVTKDLEEEEPPDELADLPPSAAMAAITRMASTKLPTDRGIVITIGGPSSLAAVEVAVGISAELADNMGTTLLIDIDETTPMVAARLGYRLEPTVLDAAESIYYGDGDLGATLTEPTQGSQGFAPMHILAGIANPDDWSLLGHDRARDLIGRATEQWKHVVVASGPQLLPMPSGTDRYGASRGAVAIGDLVIGVFDPTPTGVLQSLDWLIEARKLRGGAPVWVLFAGRPRSARQRADLVESITREAGADLIAGVMFVSMGAEVDKGCWEGKVVTSGRFAKSMRSLAAELIPPPRSSRRLGIGGRRR
ncbi:MAG: hypothetical protein GY724_06325 [Actinomycetia bacterium]|nr:hypothetical protein [Actinomycetes bacterium]MCP5031191.1 hypothetical protein [Actinomycetes bacterium]